MRHILLSGLILLSVSGCDKETLQIIADAFKTPIPTTTPTTISTPTPLPAPTITPLPTPVPAPTAKPTPISNPFTGKCKEVKKYNRSWYADHMLWKPVGENTKRPTVLMQFSELPIVSLLKNDATKTLIHKLSYRGYSPTFGGIYDDLKITSSDIKKKYVSVWLRASFTKSCTDYFLKDPTKRSDGLNR